MINGNGPFRGQLCFPFKLVSTRNHQNIIQQCFTDDLFSHRSSKSPNMYVLVMLDC